ncbi:malate synthase-domain-containing protein [Irpex lacteus]|nr:malate synthase-domain-containing protein [Irpex lacteus]
MAPAGVQILSKQAAKAQSEILTDDALNFLASLHRTFEKTRQSLLIARTVAQQRLDAGTPLDFPTETAHIRADPSWLCAPPAPGLEDRRVEITGPPERKMVINALNSGAKTFMADFEDSNSPTFANLLDGQVNLRDAIRRQIDFEINGKSYKLSQNPAVLIVRPRGWHLEEPRVLVDNEPISGSIFDFGLYFFHNAKELIARGSGPYFYLPRWSTTRRPSMERHLQLLPVLHRSPHGTIRATVLIETLPAAFQMEEILFELREHSRMGLHLQLHKRRRADRTAVLPDRSQVTMEVPFMDAYVRLLIQTCHRRKVAAMGGMSAQIPIKNDPKANEMPWPRSAQTSFARSRTATRYLDRSPSHQQNAMEVFNEHMLGPNQYHVRREDVKVTAADLLNTSSRQDHCRGRQRLYPLNHLMEDAATAEITRVQLWQYVKYGSRVADTGDMSPPSTSTASWTRSCPRSRAARSRRRTWRSSPVFEEAGQAGVAERVLDERLDEVPFDCGWRAEKWQKSVL